MSTDVTVNEVLNSSSGSKAEKKQILMAVKKVQTHEGGVTRKREQDEAKKRIERRPKLRRRGKPKEENRDH